MNGYGPRRPPAPIKKKKRRGPLSVGDEVTTIKRRKKANNNFWRKVGYAPAGEEGNGQNFSKPNRKKQTSREHPEKGKKKRFGFFPQTENSGHNLIKTMGGGGSKKEWCVKGGFTQNQGELGGGWIGRTREEKK